MTIQHRKSLIVATSIATVAVCALLYRSQQVLPEPTETAIDIAAEVHSTAIDTADRLMLTEHPNIADNIELTQQSDQVQAPPSLAGLNPPSLQWRADGTLDIDYDSRAWLEFFRSVPTEQLAQSERYKADILEQMSVEQRRQMLALEEKYHELLEKEYQLHQAYSGYGVEAELASAMQGLNGDDNAWQKAQEMMLEGQQLRRDVLGDATAQTWFEQDEAMESYTMAALAIARNPSLDESTKTQQVAQLDQMLPAAILETMVISRQSSEMAIAITQWQNEGWSEEEIAGAIEVLYGQDIATRWREG